MTAKNYSLEEIKDELNHEIEGLEALDPSWLNCRHCPNHGKCCIDNDIDIREDEWHDIKALLDQDEAIRNQVRENLINGSKCYFRTPQRCLIHPIRPTNCIYTPYQVIQTRFENRRLYSRRSDDCDFTTIEESVNPITEDTPYIRIGDHTYLYLNYWVGHFESQSIDGYKMLGEDRLKEYFNMK